MNKSVIFLSLVLSSCGGVVTGSTGGSGGVGGIGGDTSGMGGTGGDVTTITQPVESWEHLPKNCTEVGVLTPAPDNYGSVTVACYLATQPSWVSGFEFYLFSGEYNSFSCGKNDLRVVWFTTDDNVQHKLPDVPEFSQKTVYANDINWTNDQVNGQVGAVASVKVALDSSVALQPNQLFCFGHVLTVLNETTNCPIICHTDEELDYHQISTSFNPPYGFVPLYKSNLELSSVFVSSILVGK